MQQNYANYCVCRFFDTPCILHTQYNVMHVHCLSIQRNQGQVSASGIEACAWNILLSLIMLLLCQACVECIKNNVLNSSFRSNVALIRRPWMQFLLHVVRYSVLKRLRVSKFKRKAIWRRIIFKRSKTSARRWYTG